MATDFSFTPPPVLFMPFSRVRPSYFFSSTAQERIVPVRRKKFNNAEPLKIWSIGNVI